MPAHSTSFAFPAQANLSESDYLRLTDHTNRMAEFIDGQLEVLPMPTTEHQRIVLFLVILLREFAMPKKLGEVLMAPLRVKVGDNDYREPDVVFMLQSNASRRANRFWTGADLVMEVISEDDPDRDLVVKRDQYASAGISEYWIVDPRNQSITVLRLDGGRYATHSQAVGAGRVGSALLAGFGADVAAVFAAGQNA
jgi:Uma2 family endonuclease